MAAAKGTMPPNAGKGRAPGVPNKATTAFRETIQKLLESNSANVSLWLKQVAAEDPAKALDLVSKLAEYASPKLARTEVSGMDGQPLQIQVVKFGGDNSQ